MTARLSHWNTVEIFDYGRTDDMFFYVMECQEPAGTQFRSQEPEADCSKTFCLRRDRLRRLDRTEYQG